MADSCNVSRCQAHTHKTSAQHLRLSRTLTICAEGLTLSFHKVIQTPRASSKLSCLEALTHARAHHVEEG